MPLLELDYDTDVSVKLDEVDDIVTSLGVPTPPSINRAERPTSISDELKSSGKLLAVPKARATKKTSTFEGIVDKFKASVEKANEQISTLKGLAATQNKEHVITYDKLNNHINKTESYTKVVLKKAGKIAEDNKRVVKKLSEMKQASDKLKEANKALAEHLREVKKDRDELKRDKKAQMAQITALNKAATNLEKTISGQRSTITTYEKQLLKKGGSGGGVDEDLARTVAKQEAKFEASAKQDIFKLQLKKVENDIKAEAKSNRIFGFGGGGIGMMGMGGGMMGGIQNSWNQRMDMVSCIIIRALVHLYFFLMT